MMMIMTVLCPKTGPRCVSVFRLPTPELGNEVSRGGFPLPSPASNWTLTACSGPHMWSPHAVRAHFCRIGLYYPAGFRTRDFQGCTPSMLPLDDNCAPAFSCRYFQGGHPPSTNRARRCLTSVIDREPVSATPQLWPHFSH